MNNKMKNRKLNQWLWKWHFIAGVISLPFIILLAVTGTVYLFKPQVDNAKIEQKQQVKVRNTSTISYQEQWEIVKNEMKQAPHSMVLTGSSTKGTEFISGKFGGKESYFVNPYSGEVIGKFSPKNSWMYTVRKLHGELLGGKVGTKLVELIACWMIVLIITGLYVWWPFQKGLKGVFLIRRKEGRRTFFRDLHAVGGFWLSSLLLLTLAGGLPWTDVFGNGYKWVQKATNTGYPSTWNGKGLGSVVTEKKLTLDEMVTIANGQKLEGIVTIGLPKNKKSTFSVSNTTTNLGAQRMVHFDQYSGELVKNHNWSDVGVLMRGRMWLMAFHQGEFGLWNWILMFFVGVALTLLTISALVSYMLRKKKGSWGVPKVSKSFEVSPILVVIIFVLGVLLPLFGLSLLLLIVFDFLKTRKLKLNK